MLKKLIHFIIRVIELQTIKRKSTSHRVIVTRNAKVCTCSVCSGVFVLKIIEFLPSWKPYKLPKFIQGRIAHIIATCRDRLLPVNSFYLFDCQVTCCVTYLFFVWHFTLWDSSWHWFAKLVSAEFMQWILRNRVLISTIFSIRLRWIKNNNFNEIQKDI